MARPKKIGLDYFPVDVDFDNKVQSIELLHKNDGLVWVIKFWQQAYKNEFGEVDLNGLFGELFTNNCRITNEQHIKILDTALKVGFCYQTDSGTYTSDGIKKRISMVSKERSDAIGRKNKENKKKDKEKESKVKDCLSSSANNHRTIRFSDDTPEHELSVLMLDQIKNTGTTMKDPDLNKWSESFDKIHRIDKRGYDWLFNLVMIVYKDNFWKNQIRSPDKLREQINSGKLDRLVALIGNCMSDEDVIKEIKNA